MEVSVIATGFEPVTVCLEGRCSIQLSYATINITLLNRLLRRPLLYPAGKRFVSYATIKKQKDSHMLAV